MALIKCPECGENISSLAKQCIHCGCTFTVCDECGTAWCGERTTCPKCGYEKRPTAQDNFQHQNNTTKSNNAQSNTSTTSGDDVFDVIFNAQNSEMQKKIYQKIPLAERQSCQVFGLACWGCLLLTVIRIVIWYFSDPFTMVSSAESVSNFCKITLLIAFICAVLNSTVGGKLREDKMWSFWTKKIEDEKFDMTNAIRKITAQNWETLSKSDKSAKASNIRFCIMSANYKQNKVKYYHPLSGVAGAIAYIPLYVWLLSKIDTFLSFLAFGTPFWGVLNLGWLGWMLFVISIILSLVLAYYLDKHIANRQNPICLDWIHKNIPEQSEIYKQYILPEDNSYLKY